MKKHVLKATKRTVFGKKLKALRREGILPGNVYGKDLESTAVQVNMQEFKDLYKEVGATGLVEIHIEGDKARPVLIHEVHMDHVNHVPLHADFYQVNLKEKVTTLVPVVLVGESKGVADKVGELLQIEKEIEVSALPTDLPEKFEVDVTELAELDQQITVADLKVPQGVEINDEPTSIIVKLAAIVEEPEPEAETPAEEGAEGEATEESPAEEKKEE